MKILGITKKMRFLSFIIFMAEFQKFWANSAKMSIKI